MLSAVNALLRSIGQNVLLVACLFLIWIKSALKCSFTLEFKIILFDHMFLARSQIYVTWQKINRNF